MLYRSACALSIDGFVLYRWLVLYRRLYRQFYQWLDGLLSADRWLVDGLLLAEELWLLFSAVVSAVDVDSLVSIDGCSLL